MSDDSESEQEVIELGEEDSGEEEESNDSGDEQSEEKGPTMRDLYAGNVVSPYQWWLMAAPVVTLF